MPAREQRVLSEASMWPLDRHRGQRGSPKALMAAAPPASCRWRSAHPSGWAGCGIVNIDVQSGRQFQNNRLCWGRDWGGWNKEASGAERRWRGEHGGFVSAHTFTHVCQQRTEDKDARQGHERRLDAEHMTLKAAIQAANGVEEGNGQRQKTKDGTR